MIAALALGIFGSLHCLGMCGPLILSLPYNRASKKTEIIQHQVAYHSGRLLIYFTLGLMTGIAGETLRLFLMQQRISIISGVVILLIYFLPKLFSNSNRLFTIPKLTPIITKLRSFILDDTHKINNGQYFGLGMINGILPCGLVYIALVSAIAQASPFHSALFMLLFGLGTGPALILLSNSRSLLAPKTYQKLAKLTPVLVILVSSLLILRGSGLDIPFISPISNESCCHTP